MHYKRLQRSRKKGAKLPKGTVCVTRGTAFGNPFRLIGDMVYVDAGHRRKILSPWVIFLDGGGHNAKEVVELFKSMLLDPNSHDVEPEIRERFKLMRERIGELKGHNLACFCNLSDCCHGDVLLKLANQKFNLWKYKNV